MLQLHSQRLIKCATPSTQSKQLIIQIMQLIIDFSFYSVI